MSRQDKDYRLQSGIADSISVTDFGWFSVMATLQNASYPRGTNLLYRQLVHYLLACGEAWLSRDFWKVENTDSNSVALTTNRFYD